VCVCVCACRVHVDSSYLIVDSVDRPQTHASSVCPCICTAGCCTSSAA